MSAPAMQVMKRQDENKSAAERDRDRMTSDKLPLVSTLLRACRDGNELLIKQALRDVIVNGITPEELNATDKSGRTAISYICSNGLLQFLDIILQIPKIDVNKADNEGNTPLHFAAEAGRLEILNMLISRCRTLEINKKNHLGFTPLMKAAFQGRSRCAKILLMGGASALETDAKRNMRADQLAEMCGHNSCRDMIVNCAKAVMEKHGGSCKWPSDTNTYIKRVVARSNTGTLMSANSLNTGNTNGSTGIRSKLRKVFPFGLSLKDKSASNNITKNKRSETSDLVSYLSAAALCASTEPALAKDQTKFIKNLIHHHDVPKLEVTYANNNTLIKKMENSRYTEAEQHRDKSPIMVRIK